MTVANAGHRRTEQMQVWAGRTPGNEEAWIIFIIIRNEFY
jgi:hypothetical protein